MQHYVGMLVTYRGVCNIMLPSCWHHRSDLNEMLRCWHKLSTGRNIMLLRYRWSWPCWSITIEWHRIYRVKILHVLLLIYKRRHGVTLCWQVNTNVDRITVQSRCQNKIQTTEFCFANARQGGCTNIDWGEYRKTIMFKNKNKSAFLRIVKNIIRLFDDNLVCDY